MIYQPLYSNPKIFGKQNVVYFEKIKENNYSSTQINFALEKVYDYIFKKLNKGEKIDEEELDKIIAVTSLQILFPEKNITEINYHQELEKILEEYFKGKKEKFEKYEELYHLMAKSIPPISTPYAGGVSEKDLPEKFEIPLPPQQPVKGISKKKAGIATAIISAGTGIVVGELLGYDISGKISKLFSENKNSLEKSPIIVNNSDEKLSIGKEEKNLTAYNYTVTEKTEKFEEKIYPISSEIKNRLKSLIPDNQTRKEFEKFLQSFPSEYQKILVETFAKDGISEKEYKQILFLKSLEKEKQIWAIENNMLKNYDWDSDGMSNWFEKYVFKLSDPLVHNDRYIAIFIAHKTGEDDKFKIYRLGPRESIRNTQAYTSQEFIESLYNFFEKCQKIPKENVYIFVGKKATVNNISKTLEEIAHKSNKNDFVYILLCGHGNEKGKIVFWSSENSRKTSLSYGIIDKWIDKIPSKYKAIIIDACGSGSAIEFLKDNDRVILTSTGKERARTMPYHHILVGLAFSNWYPEDYLSMKKLYEDAKGNNSYMHEKMREYLKLRINPQIYDPLNISHLFYLGEFKRNADKTDNFFLALIFVDSKDLEKS